MLPETAAADGDASASATVPVPTVFPSEPRTVAPEALSEATSKPATVDDAHDAATWFETERFPVLTVEARCGGASDAATVTLPVAKSEGASEASSVVRAGKSGGSPGRVVAM